MGARVTAELIRPGFYPAGGGAMDVRIEPARRLEPIDLLERGEARGRRAVAILSSLPSHIGDRELRVVRRRLEFPEDVCEVVSLESAGPGNALLLEAEFEHVTEIVTAFGEHRMRAEKVAEIASKELRYLLRSVVGRFVLLMGPLFVVFIVLALRRALTELPFGLDPRGLLLFGMMLYAVLFSNNFVYNATGRSCHTVLCNGQVIMEDQKILGVDEDEVREKAQGYYEQYYTEAKWIENPEVWELKWVKE